MSAPGTDGEVRRRRPTEPTLVTLLYSRAIGGLSLVALVLSWTLPRGGFGWWRCWFASHVHLPCPGCGMTRSVISVAHLELADAIVQNPFGLAAVALFIASVVLGLSPRRWTGGLRRWLVARPRLCGGVLNGLGLGLILYGLVRLIVYVVTGANYGPG